MIDEAGREKTREELIADKDVMRAEIKRLKAELERYDQKDIAKTSEINILTKENNAQAAHIAQLEKVRGAAVDLESYIVTHPFECGKEYDIPDFVWCPFEEALAAARTKP